MTKEQKINFLTVPISMALIGIITVILLLTKQAWMYYLIGGLVGMMCHSLMVKQNARMTRFAALDPEHKIYNPKKSAVLWYLLRVFLLLGVFGVLVYTSKAYEDKTQIWSVVCALLGYATAKAAFIACLIFVKDKNTYTLKEEINNDIEKSDEALNVEEEKEVGNE